jgi:ABC-type antimicrobial peptide transport system permease subunit
LDRLRAFPGVEAAAVAQVVPLNDALNFKINVRTDLKPDRIILRWNGNYVGADYFKTMRIPIVEGREFLATEGPGAPPVAILNQTMARRLFGTLSAVGHTVWLGDKNPVRIVGIARNAKYMTLGEENVLAVYEPYRQGGRSVNLEFLVRASGSAQAVVPEIHSVLNRLDPTAALEAKTMQNGLALALLPSRAGAIVLGSMGLLGLVLASIGLYGVLLYAVSRRVREIGLRVALGASPGAVLKLVAGQSASLVAAGIGIGLAISIFAVRPLAMFLTPEVRTTDASNFVIVGAGLALVSLIATIAPALGALRVDPVVALRE